MSPEPTAQTATEDANLWQRYREMEAKLHRREEEIERLKAHYENHQGLIEDYGRMWRNQDSTITRVRSLAPRLRVHSERPNMIAEIADELERLTSDTQGLDAPEPAAQFKETAEDLNTTADVQVDVNEPEPLSEAEQAAAEAMVAVAEHPEWLVPADFAPEARAVVAAVRPILAAEALEAAVERLNDQADRVRTKFGRRQPPGWNRTYGLSEAASMLRADIAALRTTTSEETR